jgi:hypothetical protein
VVSGEEDNDSDWVVIQTNINGAVTCSGSSDNGNIAVFDGYTGRVIKDSGFSIEKSVPSNAVFTDTTYESLSPAEDGEDVSLVTTGEKYLWNSKTSSVGTVTSITAGTGLTGGEITSSGEINLALITDEQSTYDSEEVTDAENRQYALRLDNSGYLSTNVPWEDTKDTAGATDTDEKIYLIGSEEQTTNP